MRAVQAGLSVASGAGRTQQVGLMHCGGSWRGKSIPPWPADDGVTGWRGGGQRAGGVTPHGGEVIVAPPGIELPSVSVPN